MNTTRIRSFLVRLARALFGAPPVPVRVPAVQGLEPRQHLAADPLPVRVMTQNLAYGAGTGLDLFAGAATGGLWDNIQETNFPARAAAIAREVDAARPDLIGLQEAVIWRTGSILDLGDADDVQYDFTKILINALGQRGLWYRAVAKSTNADIAFPGKVDGDFKTIRMTDQDVILARVKRGSRVTILDTDHGNYHASFDLSIPVIGDEPFTRGWAAVDARMAGGGRAFRFVTTHLDAFDSAVRDDQAEELLEGPASSLKVPVIVAGDFNATPGSATFKAMADAGYYDAWTWTNGGARGYTGTQDGSLDNGNSKLSARIDAVFFRGKRMGATEADVVGETTADKTPEGLWPSDHAGVTATISFARRRRG
jgi:endonuclease/exonuclease/phosphatase family metal-dependent hydrolase